MSQPISEADLRSWMDRLGPRLIALSAGICRDRHRAEDIVQEAFVKLWKKPPEAGEPVYPAWMRRVVTNLSINALQRTKRPQALPEHGGDRAMHARGAGPGRETRERLGLVGRALERLDDAKRTILVLRAYEELSYEQIAEHLGIPVGTVMSRLNRARAALQEEMTRLEAGSDDDEANRTYDIRRYRSS